MLPPELPNGNHLARDNLLEKRLYSSMIEWLNDQPYGSRYVIRCRVSRSHQKSHLSDQEATIRRAVAATGGVVVGRASVGICRGSSTKNLEQLELAAVEARKKAAFLLAESVDRFVRSSEYSSCDQQVVPTSVDFELLLNATSGIKLVTVVNPFALPNAIRAAQTKRGLVPKRKPLGWLKSRREKLLPKVLSMYLNKIDKREIARQLGIGESLVRKWIKKEFFHSDILKSGQKCAQQLNECKTSSFDCALFCDDLLDSDDEYRNFDDIDTSDWDSPTVSKIDEYDVVGVYGPPVSGGDETDP